MEQIDLNISNYSLNDIFNLFKIDVDFDEEEMRAAKKIVLMTHPDKSGLDPKYFLFYTSAYRLLYNVFKVRKRGEQDTSIKRQYSSNELDETQDHSDAWKVISEKDFNKIFNEMFEKHVTINNENDGHGDWLKEEEDVEQAKNRNEMDEMIERKSIT